MPLNSPQISRVRKTNRLQKAGFLLAILAFSSVFAVRIFAQSNEKTAPLPSAIVVSTDVVQVTDSYNRSRSFTGRATAKRRSRLGFEMVGTLESIIADDGDKFIKGDILASLDTSRLQAKLQQLKAQKAEITANLRLAKNTYARVEKTKQQGHASAQLLDEAYSKLMAAKARGNAQDAAIKGLEIDLAKSVITAPFDGVITARLVDEGTIISGGVVVFDVIEAGQIEAKIGVSPAIAQHMNANTSFKLKNGLRQQINGTFKNTVASIQGQTRTMLATFDLQSDVADGEIITLVINDPIKLRGAWVPIRALSSDVRGLWRLYKIVNGDYGPEVHFENVQLLHTSGDMAYVSGSFSDGDIIIREGVDKLAKGQRVNPISHDPTKR